MELKVFSKLIGIFNVILEQTLHYYEILRSDIKRRVWITDENAPWGTLVSWEAQHLITEVQMYISKMGLLQFDSTNKPSCCRLMLAVFNYKK